MLHITSFNGHQLISVISGRDVAAIERPFVFPAHLMSLLYLGETHKRENRAFQTLCLCVAGIQPVAA